MSVDVPIRLDERTRQIMCRLKRLRGWDDSEVVCRAIQLLGTVELLLGQCDRRIVGIGEFASGIHDLGSEKGHLEQFGR